MMNIEEFRKKVERKLGRLERDQVVDFAWRCGVRALPFLGCKGRLDYWNHMSPSDGSFYQLLMTLDIVFSETADYDAVNIAMNAQPSVANDSFIAPYAAYAAAYTIADAADAAVSAGPNAALRAAVNLTDAADAADAAREVKMDKLLGEATRNTFDSIGNYQGPLWVLFTELVLSDIDQIKNGGPIESGIFIYGEIWDNFMKALESIDCTYWGHLYKDILESGFQIDNKALERRMSVPEEIQDQGAAAVARYLGELKAQGARRLNEARVVILGEKGAGKTCLARRLKNPKATMTTDKESTPGVDTHLWELAEDDINVHIWDFAGHTVTHSVHQFFLSERCLYIMVYDGRTETRNRLEYWLDHMKNYGGNSKAMIMVNRRDDHQIEIPINQLRERYSIAGLYEFDIENDHLQLEGFRKAVADYIRHNPSWEKQQIPTSYFKVKEELEDLFVKGDLTKGQEYISMNAFQEIAEKHQVGDVKELVKNLNHLGVSLWYEDLEEFDTMILNPEWISHGVYGIVNWMHNAKKYAIHINEFQKVFEEKADRYPVEKHQFLFKLIQHYKLAYQAKGKKTLILPHLMAKDRPAELPVFPENESLTLRYKADQPLPPNTISRFIVEHNEEITKHKTQALVWRYGVVLSDRKGTTALVREDDRTISVSVIGENRTQYISLLRATLNNIFEEYRSKKPQLEYKVERDEPKQSILRKPEEMPIWMENGQIANLVAKDIPFIDHITAKRIPLEKVAESFNITINNYTVHTQSFSQHQGDSNQDDHSTHNTFNFKDCNVSLQGNLNALARKLAKVDEEEAEEVKEVVEALNEAKACESPEAAKEKGLDKTIGRWMQDLADENSNLHKTVNGIKRGAGIAQDIAAEYNKLAQWLALPQVPKPFLKKGDH